MSHWSYVRIESFPFSMKLLGIPSSVPPLHPKCYLTINSITIYYTYWFSFIIMVMFNISLSPLFQQLIWHRLSDRILNILVKSRGCAVGRVSWLKSNTFVTVKQLSANPGTTLFVLNSSSTCYELWNLAGKLFCTCVSIYKIGIKITSTCLAFTICIP